MKQSILKAEQIDKSFGSNQVLKQAEIEILAGEVHALLGENGAGKSTLMNIIAGILPKDGGSIIFQGEEVSFKNPREAQTAGIGFVHQELLMCQDISVAENMFLGRAPQNKMGFINYSRLYEQTKEYLKQFEMDIDPQKLTSELNIASQQIVEIAKAISLDCKLLILDEPTSSLTDKEVEMLFRVIREIKKQGIGVVYISHRLSEIFSIADRVTVMRDGEYISTHLIKDITPEQLITKTVGREISNLYPDKASAMGAVALEVKGLNVDQLLKDISFSVRKGEILGLAGLASAGRTEIAKAVTGLLKKSSGQILLDGRPAEIKNYKAAIHNRMYYISEDRKGEGSFLDLDITNNTIASILDRVSRGKFLLDSQIKKITDDYVLQLKTKISSNRDMLSSLSGGNQQKVMIAKGLATQPKVLFIDEPTRGVDVGAKYEIHKLLRELANEGMAVVMISSELPEVIGLCDRVLVVHEGRLSGELSREELSEEHIILLASGQHIHSF